MPKGHTNNPDGRKPNVIDWPKVEKLCYIQCTGEEIASILGIDYDTLEKAIKREHKLCFTDYYKKHAAGGRASLRRMQYKSAEKGNPTMLIWLGKQYLNQTDKHDVAVGEFKSDDEFI
jgi:hypothetical protein